MEDELPKNMNLVPKLTHIRILNTNDHYHIRSVTFSEFGRNLTQFQ